MPINFSEPMERMLLSCVVFIESAVGVKKFYVIELLLCTLHFIAF